MLQFGPTFIWVAVNLLLLYIILKKVLFKPVTAFMENRKNAIKESIENAEKMKADVEASRQKYEAQIRGAKDEAEKIVSDARVRGNKEYDAIINAAKQDAEGIMVKAREEIDRERAQMVKDIQGQVAGLALIIASKVLGANMDTESNRVLANKFIDEVGAE